MQKDKFYITKGHVLQCNLPSFATQKAAICSKGQYISGDKRHKQARISKLKHMEYDNEQKYNRCIFIERKIILTIFFSGKSIRNGWSTT